MLTAKIADPEAAMAAIELREAPSLKGVRIYCIDDDALIIKLYERIFSGVGAQVTCETRPERALEHLKQDASQYDVVITDVKMPRLTGYQLLQVLEEHHARPEIIIASTANVLRSAQDKNQLERFDAVFSKPLNRASMLRRIAELTGRKASGLSRESVNSQDNARKEARPDTAPVYEHSPTAPNGNPDYSLDDYRAFAMDDDDFLQEIIQDLLRENEKDLSLAFELLEKGEKTPLDEIIHKMSSRFAQLQVTDKSDAKQLELDLRAGHERIPQARDLLKRWKAVHNQMAEDHAR